METPPWRGGAQEWHFRNYERFPEDSPPTAPLQDPHAPVPPLPGLPTPGRRDRTRREDGRTNAVSPVRHESDAWRHIGEITDGVVCSIGLQAIRFHLNRAAASGGCEALASVREANAIRRQLGLSWDQVVTVDGALG